MAGETEAGINIGVSGFAWSRQFGPRLLPVLGTLREHGLQGFEVPMFNPGEMEVLPLRREIEKQGLECTACAILPAHANPISPDENVRAKALEHLTECVRKTAEMGGRLLCGPLYAPIGYLHHRRGTSEEWDWAVSCFQRLGDTLDAHDVDLAIEPVNRAETFFLRTASEAAMLCKRIDHPRIGITIDTFHANIEEKNLAGAVQSCSSRLKHIHASENDRGALGSGHVDFRELIAELLTWNYSGYLMIEGFGFSVAERDSPAQMLGMFDRSPEEIAFGGAEFLRRVLAEQGS